MLTARTEENSFSSALERAGDFTQLMARPRDAMEVKLHAGSVS